MTGVDDGFFFAEQRRSSLPPPPPPPPPPVPTLVARLPGAADPEPEAMTWSDYLAAAWRNWWIILLALLLGVGAAYASTAVGTKSYASETRVAVAPIEGLPPNVAMSAISAEKVGTAAELMTGSALIERAADQAGIPRSQAAAYAVAATASLRGSTVDLVVTGPDAAVGAKLSSAVVEIVSAQYGSLYTGFRLSVVDGPTVATSTSGPPRSARLAVGAILGLGVGVLIAVARESRRRARA